jgi:hypothetical protein
MSNDKYILDNKSPFSVTGESGKLPDGKVRESAFVKFRSTGVLTTSVDGPTFICLFAGAGNVTAWKIAGAGGNAIHPAYGTWLPPLFNGHTASPAFGQVKHFRTTSVGLQLESVQDDDSIGGYFEAVRFPESDVGNGFLANVSTAGEVFPTLLVGLDQVL